MTSYKPQVGDIVKYEGTVVHVYEDGAVDLEDGGYIGIDFGGLTLVEHPDPKITIELTEHQARCLASCGEYGHAPDTRKAAAIIRQVLRERS